VLLISIYFKVALKNYLILPGILNKNTWKIQKFSGNFLTSFQ